MLRFIGRSCEVIATLTRICSKDRMLMKQAMP